MLASQGKAKLLAPRLALELEQRGPSACYDKVFSMARAKKIAITVDGALLARAERLRRSTDESRSAVFARALRALLREEERHRKIAEYVEGYRRMPETAAEVAWVDAASAMSLRDVPWDDA